MVVGFQKYTLNAQETGTPDLEFPNERQRCDLALRSGIATKSNVRNLKC
jgi:hypothetical protein